MLKERTTNNSRKWLSLIIAILLYYVIHEGSHVIVSLLYGVFEKIRILGLGIQVVVNTEILTNFQIAIFCVVGSVSTLLVAYLLVLFTKRIVESKNKLFKAICYYTTLAFLLLDPLYLTITYKFVGGGDMNGILLFGVPEIVIQIIFGIIAIINISLIVKMVYPAYKKSFSE